MYGSIIESLINLYPKISKKGYCIIDDDAIEGCKMAVDDYRSDNKIDDEIKIINWSEIYLRKTKQRLAKITPVIPFDFRFHNLLI